ncbi:MAG: HEAT repeat domain-containing protein [Anaerolineaceae bacterium]|nr:HEAT repeat domain-containing protein [Anaerolineaceae bacterium]
MADHPMEEHSRISVTDPSAIQALIIALGSMNDTARFTARKALVRIGKPAEPALIHALKSGNHLTRWGAAKALIEIGDPANATQLVMVLEDDVFDIRWIASEGLIALGYSGLDALLQALIDHPDLASLREGAQHVLHVLSEMGMGQLLAPVQEALESISPATALPPAAQRALHLIRTPG